ncbi:MAG TPA: hypothetical protein VNZ45_10515, partial [Bacteroidia bacterium]|nr:hypothetical protein [Bacteroidia bacterium]
MKKIIYCLALVLFVMGTALTVHAVTMSSVGTLQPSAKITYPIGCSAATRYSAATGLPCSSPAPSLINYPSGCTSTTGYSRTTGQPCSGTSTNTACVGTAPSITITSPNGGEVYQNNQQIPVTWKTCNMTSSDLINIHVNEYNNSGQIVDGTATSSVTTGTAIVYNTGSTTLTAPNTWGGISSLPSGAYYKLSLVRVLPGGTIYGGNNDTTTTDLSNNLFSIVAPISYPAGCTSASGYSSTTGQSCSSATTPTSTSPSSNLTYPSSMILVTSPNGGTYQPGQTIVVQWVSSNVPASTLLEVNFVSTDGSIFGFLEPNGTPNDGSDTITIPASAPIGKNYQIAVGVPINSDLTNSNMNVSAKSIMFSLVANTNLPAGCTSTAGFSSTTGQSCNGSVATPVASVPDTTPRIAYWQGKVDQHVNVWSASTPWLTDTDGTSGAQIDKLTYCQKWYPNTVSVQAYKTETITGWRDAGNTGGPYTLAVQSYQCVQSTAPQPSVTLL